MIRYIIQATLYDYTDTVDVFARVLNESQKNEAETP